MIEAEITVKRVDQYLEGSLKRVIVGAFGRPFRLFRPLFGVEPVAAQVLQQAEEDAEFVRSGLDRAAQHERRIERPDVHVMNVPDHAFHEHVGVTARKGPGLVRERHGAALAQVFPQQEGVNLGRVAPDADVLIRKRYHLGLDERALGKKAAHRFRLRDVVLRIAHQHGGIGLEQAGDGAPLDIDAVRRREAEMLRHLLQAVALQRTMLDVVGVRQKQRVNDVAADDVEPRVGNRAFARGEPARARTRLAPVPAKGQLDTVPFGARGDVRQVEIEEIVALDHVRIPLAHCGDKTLQQLLLAELDARQDPPPTGVVGHRNGDEAVLLAIRVAEFEAVGGEALDIHLQAPEVVKAHSLEQGAAGRKQMLLDGIVDDEEWRVRVSRGTARLLRQPGLGGLARLPGSKRDPPPERVGALKRLNRTLPQGTVQQVLASQKHERRKGFLRPHRVPAAPKEHRHAVAVRTFDRLGRHQGVVRAVAVNEKMLGLFSHHGEADTCGASRDLGQSRPDPTLTLGKAVSQICIATRYSSLPVVPSLRREPGR